MIFNLEGYKVNFDEKFITYNELRMEYFKISEEVYKRFINEYDNNCSNMEDVNLKALTIAYNCLGIAINKAIEKLISNNLITVDKDTFMDKYCYEFITLEEDFEEINNKYIKLLMTEEQEKEYREERKNARGRWEGGGFGISGAVKGAMQAGAMNMASEMAHSIFNSIGNLNTSNAIEKEKQALFNNANTKATLANSVKKNCFMIHFAIINTLIDNGINKYEIYVTDEMKSKSKALLNNLKTGFIPRENNALVIEDIIKNNPYNIDVYLYLLDKCGNEHNQIVEITEFLGLNVKSYIAKLVDNYFINVEKSTEEETFMAIDEFKEYAKYLNYTDISRYLIMFDNLLKQHDINIRTVDGILFEEREEAKIAKFEFEKIIKIKEDVNVKNEKIIQDAINKINNENFITVIKDRHLLELEVMLADSIILADQVLLNDKYSINREFSSEEEVNIAIEELKDLEIRTKDLKEERIRAYEGVKAKIIEKEEKVLLDNYFSKYVILTEMDLDFVKEKIRALNLRTEKLKEEKINDLEFKSIFIIKKHNSQLEKAIRYEQRINAIKEVKQSSKSGFFGMINKVIEKGTNMIEDMQEKSEKEAWYFITDNGNRTIEDVKANNYIVNF